jgi:hypothetical protein
MDQDEELCQSPPLLFYLLDMGDWSNALCRIRKYPSEVMWVGKDGDNMLHVCFDSSIEHVPIEIISEILVIHPSLLVMRKNGCSIVDVILLSLCDLVRSGTRSSDCEFKLRFHVIHQLLQRSISYKNKEIVTKTTIEYMVHVVRLWNQESGIELGRGLLKSDVASLKFIFAVMDLILEVYFRKHCRSAREKPFVNFLHRLVDIRRDHSYPLRFFYLSLESIGAHGCHEYDDIGRTVLVAIILSMKNSNDNCCHVKMIEKVLQKGHGTSMYPYKNGRLPLHLLLDRGGEWSNGISLLAADAPQSLRRQDPITLLFPFMQASSNGSNLNTVYMLLYQDPTVISELNI